MTEYEYYNEHGIARHDFVRFLCGPHEPPDAVLADLIVAWGGDLEQCRPFRYHETHVPGYHEWYREMLDDWRRKRAAAKATA